jgi:hypothetical protein
MALLTSSKATIGMLRRLIVYNKMLVFSFYSLFSPFFCFIFYCLPLLFLFGFYCPSFFPFFLHLLFVFVFQLLWISSLAYPNLLGTKRLGCCIV